MWYTGCLITNDRSEALVVEEGGSAGLLPELRLKVRHGNLQREGEILEGGPLPRSLPLSPEGRGL